MDFDEHATFRGPPGWPQPAISIMACPDWQPKKIERYSQSHLGWHFRMLFQSAKLKARTSLFTETCQKRLSSFEVWTFANVTAGGIGCTLFLSLFISLTRCWFVLSEEVDLDSTSLVWFCWHQLPLLNDLLRNTVPREITVTYRDPWMGFILRPKLIALDFRKRTRERMGTLGGNHICFRKSLSQTFDLIG